MNETPSSLHLWTLHANGEGQTINRKHNKQANFPVCWKVIVLWKKKERARKGDWERENRSAVFSIKSGNRQHLGGCVG